MQQPILCERLIDHRQKGNAEVFCLMVTSHKIEYVHRLLELQKISMSRFCLLELEQVV